MNTPLTQNCQISHGNTHGDGACCYVVSHTPPQGGGVPAIALPIFGVMCIGLP